MMKRLLGLVLIFCLIASTASAVVYELPDGRSVIIGLGGSFAYTRDTEGTVRVFGDNQFGQLGRGSKRHTYAVEEFTTKAEGLDVTQLYDIVSGSDYSFMWMQDGSLWGVGYNCYLPLATRSGRYYTHVPVVVPEKPAALASGFGHMLLLTENGEVYAWGRNSQGQVGNGNRKNVMEPYKLGLQNIVQIACGGKFSIALDADGKLWGWGDNEYHNLNPGKHNVVSTPEIIDTGDIDIAYIDACGNSIVVLDTQGTLWTWGRNDFYQLGYDTKLKDGRSPQAVELPLPVTYVAAYSSQTYAILEDGSVWSWGNNSYGQLGQGFRSAASKGVLPGECWNSAEKGQKVVLIQGGSLCCLAMLEDGTVLSAGISKFGQLGEGTSKNKHTLSPNGMDLILD